MSQYFAFIGQIHRLARYSPPASPCSSSRTCAQRCKVQPVDIGAATFPSEVSYGLPGFCLDFGDRDTRRAGVGSPQRPRSRRGDHHRSSRRSGHAHLPPATLEGGVQAGPIARVPPTRGCFTRKLAGGDPSAWPGCWPTPSSRRADRPHPRDIEKPPAVPAGGLFHGDMGGLLPRNFTTKR